MIQSDNKILEVRNKIFLERGVPVLEANSFKPSPFSTSWYGKDDLGDYAYELCRISESSHLQVLFVDIIKGERWIQISLNIFKLKPVLESVEQLKGGDGLHYHLPPNSMTKMRLRVDSIKGMPLLNYHFMFGGHKLKSFRTESSLQKRVKELGDLIEKDLKNIDSFIKRWHELHQLAETDWEGKLISS